MNILITGNMGYVGSVLVKHLKSDEQNSKLIGFDTGYFQNCLTGTKILPEKNIDYQFIGDIREISPDILEGIDHIVHLAAISNDPIGNEFEDITMSVNYNSTAKLAEYAIVAGVKSFTFASSCSVYGNATLEDKTETSLVNPLTAYANSKVNAEEKLKELACKNFKVTCFRFATACGMSDRLRLDLVLNDFVASALASNKIEILSDGSPWRPLINVEDMARALHWGINRQIEETNEFMIINAGKNENNIQIKELAGLVKENIPSVNIEINKNAQPDKRSYKVDFSLFNTLADKKYLPQKSLDETISELNSELKKMNFADKNFRTSELIRLQKIKNLRTQQKLNENLQWVS